MNEKKKNVLEVFNLVAEDYVNYFGNDWEFIAEINSFIQSVGVNANVLDLGCGSGYITNYLSQNKLNSVGIDFSSKMIEIANKNFPLDKFIKMDISDVANYFKEDTFNGLLSIYSLYFIPKNEIDKVLFSLSKILKDNGKMLLVTQCGNGEQFVDEELMPNGKKKNALFVNLYTENELTELLMKHNFNVEKMNFFPNIDPNEIAGEGRLVVIASNNKHLKKMSEEKITR